MSYILEALKKAQAERQLGDTPTLHAAQVVADAPVRATGSRMPMLVGAAAGMVGAGAAAMLFWRHEAPPQTLAHAPAATAPAIAAPAVPAAAPGGATAATNTVAAPAQVAAASPAIAAPPPVALAPHAAPVPARAASQAPAPVTARPSPQSLAAGLRADAPARTEPPPAAGDPAARMPSPASAPATEEVVRTLAELPDAIQREVPKVAFGGYMYSPNAADRLVLVDKTLRHEGEEVAPGLLLEKLLPKTAVLNYKGYRFRVGL